MEPTTVCNAACPQCGREDPRFYNDQKDSSELDLDQIMRMFQPEFIRKLEKMFMCGNFGEPAAGKHTVEIYQYFKKHNANLVLGMNTNGSIRNPGWWQDLAQVFNHPLSYVVFSIDGLDDTNHIYRRNTVWSKILDNARAFIQAGGSAHWDMLVYEHNEHQVEQAQALAESLGFSWFRAKVSKRFFTNPVDWLRPPKNHDLPNVKILPCCWFGAETFTLDTHAKYLLSDWNNHLLPSWTNDPHRICKSTCAVDHLGTSFSKQWQIEKQLK